MSMFSPSGRRSWQILLDRLFPWRRRKTPVLRQPYFRLRIEWLEDRLTPADFYVPGDAKTLGAALSLVAASPDVDNTIVLGSGTFASVNQLISVPAGKSLTIAGNGTQDTILSAGGKGRVLEIDGGNVYLCDLTITGGLLQGTGGADLQGGGVLIDGGEVTLSNVMVKGNAIQGGNGKTGLVGKVGDVGQNALGGGVYMAAGALKLFDSTFSDNTLLGGKGGNGGVPGSGFKRGPRIGGSDSLMGMSYGTGQGQPGGTGGAASGGGLYVNSGSVVGERVAFLRNQVAGGAGGNGSDGIPEAVALFLGQVGAGPGGYGGEAKGAGFYLAGGNMSLFGANVSDNQGVGGAGGNAGAGGRNPAAPRFITAGYGPGPGGHGGNAAGGGCYVDSGSLALVTSTFANDRALGGAGGKSAAGGDYQGGGGAGGKASGGGIYDRDGRVEMYDGGISGCKAIGGAGADAVHKGLDQLAQTRPGPSYVTKAPYFYPRELLSHGNGLGGLLGGIGGGGGEARGGGVYVGRGSISIFRGNVSDNLAQGGHGGKGANGGRGGKGLDGGDYVYYNHGFSYPDAKPGGNGGYGGPGGSGGSGGDALGGGCFVKNGALTLVDATVANDSALGGAGGKGGDGAPGGDGGKGPAGAQAFYGVGGGRGGFKPGGPGVDGGNGGGGGSGGDGGYGGRALGGGVYAYFSVGDGFHLYGGVISGTARGGDGGNAGNGVSGSAGGEGGKEVPVLVNAYDYVHNRPYSFYQTYPNGHGGRGGGGGGSVGGDGGAAFGGGVVLLSLSSFASPVIDGTKISGTETAGKGGQAGSAGAAGASAANPNPLSYPPSPGAAVNGANGQVGGATEYNGARILTHGPTATRFVVSPMPAEVQANAPLTYPVYVVAEDDSGVVAGDYHGLASLHLKGLTLTELSSVAWTKDQPGYLGTIQVSGGSRPYSAVVTGLPAGLAYSIDPKTGLLSITGTPTEVGDASVDVTISDPGGRSVEFTYTLTINPPITLGSLSTTSWTQDQSGYVGTIPVSGGTLPYRSNVQVTGLPPGLYVSSFDSTTGVITITGTPKGPPIISGGGGGGGGGAGGSGGLGGTGGFGSTTGGNTSGGPGGVGGPGGPGSPGGEMDISGTYAVKVTVFDVTGASGTYPFSLVIQPAGSGNSTLGTGSAGTPGSAGHSAVPPEEADPLPGLTGTLTVQAVHGVAKFTDVRPTDFYGTGYTLIATSAEKLRPTDSNPFDIGGTIAVADTVEKNGMAVDYTSIARGFAPNETYQVALFASPDEKFHPEDKMLATQTVRGSETHGTFQLNQGAASADDIDLENPFLIVVANPAALIAAATKKGAARIAGAIERNAAPTFPLQANANHNVGPVAVTSSIFVDAASPTTLGIGIYADDTVRQIATQPPPGAGNGSVGDVNVWFDYINEYTKPIWEPAKNFVHNNVKTVFEGIDSVASLAHTNSQDDYLLYSIAYNTQKKLGANVAAYLDNPNKGTTTLSFLKTYLQETVQGLRTLITVAPVLGKNLTQAEFYVLTHPSTPYIAGQALLQTLNRASQPEFELSKKLLAAKVALIDKFSDYFSSPTAVLDFMATPAVVEKIMQIGLNSLRYAKNLKNLLPGLADAADLAANFQKPMAEAELALEKKAATEVATDEAKLLEQSAAVAVLEDAPIKSLTALKNAGTEAQRAFTQKLLDSYANGHFDLALVLEALAEPRFMRSAKQVAFNPGDPFNFQQVMVASLQQIYERANALTVKAIDGSSALESWARSQGLDLANYNLKMINVSTPGNAVSLSTDRDAVLCLVGKGTERIIEVKAEVWVEQAYKDFRAAGEQILKGIIPNGLQDLYNVSQVEVTLNEGALKGDAILDRAFGKIFNQVFTTKYNTEASQAFSKQASYAFDPSISNFFGVPVPKSVSVSNYEQVLAGKALLRDPHGFSIMCKAKIEPFFNPLNKVVTLADGTVVDLSIINAHFQAEAIAQMKKVGEYLTKIRHGYELQNVPLTPLKQSIVDLIDLLDRTPTDLNATDAVLENFLASLSTIGDHGYTLEQAVEALTAQFEALKPAPAVPGGSGLLGNVQQAFTSFGNKMGDLFGP